MADPKTLSEAIGLAKAPVDTACKLIEGLLGEPCRVAGNLLADQIYAWQWRNRIRIAEKAKRLLDAKGVAPRVVPAGFLLPLLDAAGKVEDPDLQQMWAQLLASGIEDDEQQHPMLVDVLRRMSGSDAVKFRNLHRDLRAAAARGLFLRTNEVDVGRLVALQLLVGTIDSQPMELAGRAHVGMDNVRLTPFGLQFAAAVGLNWEGTPNQG